MGAMWWADFGHQSAHGCWRTLRPAPLGVISEAERKCAISKGPLTRKRWEERHMFLNTFSRTRGALLDSEVVGVRADTAWGKRRIRRNGNYHEDNAV